MKTLEKIGTTFRKAPALVGLVVAVLLLAGLLLMLAGLPSGPVVTGMVRLDGQPLPRGSIRFVPVDDTPGSDSGAAIREGKYSIPKGLRVGRYKVEIEGTYTVPGKPARDPVFFQPTSGKVEAFKFAELSDPIRAVGPGRNTHNFDLHESKPGKPRR
jgi:hypothetical protein